MNEVKIGPIEIIAGEKNSRSPFSTSLLIRGKDDCTLIDCGGGMVAFDYLKKQNIRRIFVTHAHPDHTNGLHLFRHTHVFTNPYDYQRMVKRAELAKKDSTIKSAGTAQFIYPYHHLIEMSGVRAVMLHAPGHCEGFCCPYFPDFGLILIGDIDLTSFGPWYFAPDSDIDQFIESARKTLEVDAKYYVTSHQKGMVLQTEYKQKLEQYLDIIERRENKVKRAVEKGCPPTELVWQDIIYFRKNVEQMSWILRNEQMGVAKHLHRLVKHGEPFHDYFEEFLVAHKMDKQRIEGFTKPDLYGPALTDLKLNW